MKTKTLEKIIRMLEFSASKDETRPVLGCVLIEKNKLVTTDGHILSQCALDDDAFPSECKILVHRDELPFLKLALKENKKRLDLFEYKVEQNTLSISKRDVSYQTEFKFPNCEQITPKYTENDLVIGFNPALLLSLCQSMSDTKKERLVCKITIKNKDNAIRVVVGESEGLIMPVRI